MSSLSEQLVAALAPPPVVYRVVVVDKVGVGVGIVIVVVVAVDVLKESHLLRLRLENLNSKIPLTSTTTALRVFRMNSRFDILFLTCGEVRSTESRISEKHIT